MKSYFQVKLVDNQPDEIIEWVCLGHIHGQYFEQTLYILLRETGEKYRWNSNHYHTEWFTTYEDAVNYAVVESNKWESFYQTRSDNAAAKYNEFQAIKIALQKQSSKNSLSE